jgi:hypothetical protein
MADIYGEVRLLTIPSSILTTLPGFLSYIKNTNFPLRVPLREIDVSYFPLNLPLLPCFDYR